MKTFVRNVMSQLGSLLAWAAVLGVLFLGAQNASAQGFPVKPRFQDVRIGYTSFSECETWFGAGNCDLTTIQGVFSSTGFATDGNVNTQNLGVDVLAQISSMQLTGGTWDIQSNGAHTVTHSGGNADYTINDGQLTFTTSAASVGDIEFTVADTFQVDAVGVDLGIGGGAYELRIQNNDVTLQPSDDVRLLPTDDVEIVGAELLISSPIMNVSSPTMTVTSGDVDFAPTTFTVNSNAGTAELDIADNFVFIQAETTISSTAGDVALSAGDTALLQGTTSATLTSTNAANVTGGNVVLTSNATTIAANANTGFVVDAAAGTDELTITSGNIAVAGTTDIQGATVIDGGGGADEITVGTGTVTLTGAVVLPTTTTISGQNLCRADGTNCPTSEAKTFGTFSNGGSCSTVTSSNISGCSRTAQGILSITFTTAFAAAPACTANATNADQITVRVTSTTGGVTLRTFQDGGGLDDQAVSLICLGDFP